MKKKQDSKQSKKVAIIKLHIQAGKAAPAPPVGTVLGPTGIKMMDFCREFNDKTKHLLKDGKGPKIPVTIYIKPDKTFYFTIKKPTISCLIKDSLQIEGGAQNPGKEVKATITVEQVMEIVNEKISDLNTNDIKKAANIIAGSAKSMGIIVKGLEKLDLLAKGDDVSAAKNKIEVNNG